MERVLRRESLRWIDARCPKGPARKQCELPILTLGFQLRVRVFPAAAAIWPPVLPWGRNPIGPEVRDYLAHVLVRMYQKAQVEAPDRGLLIEEGHWSIEFRIAGLRDRLLRRSEGQLQEI